ncbi:STOREKEEPER protein-like [Rhododendron vialii]|uniref:STOREKEEPER protein-like n=1 Tax=Rhododendron vialii TaxID=182163 RepID=UPI00265F8D87|nr:STOREKEEPER protein-like [Rhododendron vialii]
MGRKKVAQNRAPLEEDDEQLTHHEQEQEQESHNQEPAKQTPACESSEDEEQDEEELEVEEEQKVEKNKFSVQKPINLTKPQHSQSSDSDPGSDSETHLGSPTASGFTIEPVSPQPKKPTSGKRLVPEFERKADESSRKKKKAKVFEEAAEKKKSVVGAINRLWSEEDEFVILEGLMNFKSSDMGGLYEVIKKSLSVDASKSQFVDKIHKLKRKYSNNVERGDKAVLSSPHEHKCFELSKKIWGGGKENNNGGDGNGKNVGKKARKTGKRDDAVALPEENDGKESAVGEENKNGVDGNGKSNGTKRARKKTVKLDDVALPREESGEGVVALGEGSKGGEMKDMKADKVGDFWATHPCLKQSLAMEKEPLKGFMMENMSMIGDVKAKELEKKWKDFYVDEVGLYLKRVQLMKEQTKLVLDTMKASKD